MVNFSAEERINPLTRIFFSGKSFGDGEVVGAKEEAHYLKNVLRAKKGNEIVVLDGKGGEFLGCIERLTKNEVKIKIKEEIKENKEPAVNITLVQGLCKKDKWELIIQKVTELGVKKIQPFYSDNCVIDYKSDKELEKKRSRWEKIVKNAAEQSNRQMIPEIEAPCDFNLVLNKYADTDKKIILYESERNNFFYKNGENIFCRKIKDIVFVVGPEGGFNSKEITLAREYGFCPIGLGPRILRTETAAIVAAGLIMYKLGEMGG